MYRPLSASDEAAMIEYLKLACRPSAERRARVAALRKSDAQYDHDVAVDDRESWVE